MSLEDLGNIGEFVAAVAVIVSLIYLAAQISQNTRALKANGYQGVLDSFRDLNRLINEKPDLAEIFLRGINSYEELRGVDRFRFFVHMAENVLHFQKALHLHETRMLDDVTFEAFRKFTLGLLQTSGGKAIWEECHHLFTPTVADHLNKALSETGDDHRQLTGLSPYQHP